MRKVLATALLLAGCATPVGQDARGDADGSTSGFVVTTRTMGAAGDRTAVRAAFVRVADVRTSVEIAKTLGLEPDLPDEGACRPTDVVAATPGAAELLDAGEVWIGDREQETRLVARAFPDLLSVSGVVYTTPSDEMPRVGRDAQVRITGALGVEPHEVDIGVGMPSVSARRTDDVLTFDEPEPGDRTWIDVGDAQGSRRCTVPAEATSFVANASPSATITIHRDRRRTHGSLTVRMETVEIVGDSVPSSGS